MNFCPNSQPTNREGAMIVCWIYFAILIAASTAQECLPLNAKTVQCVDSEVNLECPANHTLLVLETLYLQTNESTCPAPGSTLSGHECNVSSSVPGIPTGSRSEGSLSVQVETMDSETCDLQGNDLVYVKHRCRPTTQESYSFLDDSTSLTSDSIDLNSQSEGATKVYQASTGCNVTVDPNIEAKISLTRFTPESADCPQELRVWDGVVLHELCFGSSNVFLPCNPEGHDLFIDFLTQNESVGINFKLSIEAPLGTEGLTISCGVAITNRRRRAVQENTDTKQGTTCLPTMEDNRKKSFWDVFEDPKILWGTVAGGIVLVIILIIIIVCCSKRKKEVYGMMPPGAVPYYVPGTPYIQTPPPPTAEHTYYQQQ